MKSSLLFSNDLEQIIIATFLDKPHLLQEYKDTLHADHFHDKNHGIIINCIIERFKQNKHISEEDITTYLVKTIEDWDVTSLVFDAIPDSVHLSENIYKLKKLYKKRIAAKELEICLKKLYSEQDYDDTFNDLEKIITEMRIKTSYDFTLSIAIKETLDLAAKRDKGEGVIRLGWPELDTMLQGFLPGQLIILGARASMGKSSLAMSMAHAMLNFGKKIVLFSLEMPQEEILRKSFAIITRLPFRTVSQPYYKLTDKEKEVFYDSLAIFAHSPFKVFDSVYNLNEIKSMARKLKREGSLEVLIIDYLGLINTDRKKETNLNNIIGQITREIKLLAKELAIPIILLSQLNRKDEDTGRPKLHNLRDSGSIEQDADIVLLLYREHYYNPEAPINDAELIVAKQRLGPLGTVHLYYDPETMIFEEKNEKNMSRMHWQ